MEKDKAECFMFAKHLGRNRVNYYCGSKKYIYTEILFSPLTVSALIIAVTFASTVCKSLSLEILVIGLILIIGLCIMLFNINKKEASKLRDPQLNPEGYKYQGRKLSEDHPHVRMHLRNYEETDRMSLTQEERNIYRATGLYEGEDQE